MRCRGSLEIGDVLSDVRGSPMEVHLLGVAGSVHEGLMGAATFVHCNTAQALERAGQDHPGLPLLIAGHSMGGAPPQLHQAAHSMQGAPRSLAHVAHYLWTASHQAAISVKHAYQPACFGPCFCHLPLQGADACLSALLS